MVIADARKKREISDGQKEALSLGRDQSRIVKRYLEAIAESKPRPGRKRTEESIRSQLAGIDARLGNANPLNRLHIIQLKMDLESELAQLESKTDLEPLERSFIEVAAEYSSRKGISKQAWKEVGVPVEVLKKAGIADSYGGNRRLSTDDEEE